MKAHYVTWWNVENLFDEKTSPRRPEWLEKKLNRELKGWTSEVLVQKIENLASIMMKINEGKGADIFGLCEVENLHVLQLLTTRLNQSLPDRQYEIILHNSDDKRGIDIGVIYDANEYGIRQLDGKDKIFTYRITKRSPTRDILQIELITKAGNDLVLLLNHWYSRLAGQFESEPYRIISAETLSYWVMRIQEELGRDIPILVMGDFNDEPHDRSLVDYALSCNNRQKVLRGRNPYLYNLMWEAAGNRQGTHVYGSEITLIDQFLAAKGMLKKDSKIRLSDKPARIELFDELVKGSYNTPIRFKNSAGKFNTEGYSDHLPISIQFEEEA